ncbi:hypothetical protein [Alloalcanivorax marinus]|uniref:hypothetical protein n=1 Tax=Alloalcanivorax marinus TaxID=1177169 RepID=UPI00195640D9|nr:hypothetical protein [Alloalcanivorax marinus]MBM7332680.1 hypothetical protein [Alloalcanivorax marinus]
MVDEMSLELSWESASLVEELGEPDRLIYPFFGDILGVDDDDGRTLIGKFQAWYIDVSRAINEQESVFDVMDSLSVSIAEYFDPIFGENSPHFSDAVDDISDCVTDGYNLLILDRIEVLPQFRGRRIGLKVLRQMMVRFSPGAGVIALKAFPLQLEHESFDEDARAWRERLDLNSFVQDEEVSMAKLQDYYSTLGFKAIPNSDFMIFCTGWPIPSLDDGLRRRNLK